MPLLSELAEMNRFGGTLNTGDVGQVTSAKTAANRELDGFEEFLFFPLRFEPVKRDGWVTLFGLAAATAVTNRDLNELAPRGVSLERRWRSC